MSLPNPSSYLQNNSSLFSTIVSTLHSTMGSVQINQLLQNPNATLFLPINSTFDPKNLAYINSLSISQLSNLLFYHVTLSPIEQGINVICSLSQSTVVVEENANQRITSVNNNPVLNDVQTSGARIVGIQGLLLPSDISSPSTTCSSSTPDTCGAQVKSLQTQLQTAQQQLQSQTQLSTQRFQTCQQQLQSQTQLSNQRFQNCQQSIYNSQQQVRLARQQTKFAQQQTEVFRTQLRQARNATQSAQTQSQTTIQKAQSTVQAIQTQSKTALQNAQSTLQSAKTTHQNVRKINQILQPIISNQASSPNSS